MMDRRGFVHLTGAAFVLGPALAAAQSAGIRRIGVLSTGRTDTTEERWESMAPMRALGWFEGRNLVVERRFADHKAELLGPYAEELVRLKVDLILVFGTEAAFAAKAATSTIPIVLGGVGDPVGTGLVRSLNHPGNNITGYTGLSPDVEAKRAELMHELLPSAGRIAVVVNPTNRITPSMRKQTGDALRSLGVEPIFIDVSSEQELADVPAKAVKLQAQALLTSLGTTRPAAEAFIQATFRHGLPTVVGDRDMLEAGALMAFDANNDDEARRVSAIIDKLLRGAKAADIPIEQPTRFLLGINLKAAKALGVTVPQSLLARADEVIR
jgi:putative ABC transport system substrate-binding protein